MRRKWFIKLNDGGIIELSSLTITKNTGKFITYAGFQDTKILLCFGEEHNIKITNVEPLTYNLLETFRKNKITFTGDITEIEKVSGAIEGWATYDFEFLDFNEELVNLYEKYIDPNSINPNLTHPINIIKGLSSIIKEHKTNN